MLYPLLKRLIENGQTNNIEEKLDVFYATDKITKEQYEELINILHK